MGMMRYMLASQGDAVCTWGDTKIEGVDHLTEDEVKAKFDAVVAAGYSAVEVEGGKPARPVDRFVATAEELILFPNVVAG